MTSPYPFASAWRAAHLSVIGSGHVKNDLPCQDASLASSSTRPFLIVCDGRGSAAKSDLGSAAATEAFERLVEDAAPMLVQALDTEDAEGGSAGKAWRHFAELAYSALGNVSKRLSRAHGRPPADFDFTLVAAVIGENQAGWLHVGDGFLAMERGESLTLLSSPENGEFANQTMFVRPDGEGLRHLKCGLVPLAGVTAIAASTDGCEPLLLDARTQLPARAFSQLFTALRKGEDTENLVRLLTLQEWEERTRDDRSLAILALSSNEAARRSSPNPTLDAPVKSPAPREETLVGNSHAAASRHGARRPTTEREPTPVEGFAVTPTKRPTGKLAWQKSSPVVFIAVVLVVCLAYLLVEWPSDTPRIAPAKPPVRELETIRFTMEKESATPVNILESDTRSASSAPSSAPSHSEPTEGAR